MMFTFPIMPQPPKPNSDEKKESDFDLEYEEIDFDVKSYNFLRKLGFDDTRAWLMALQGVNHSQVRNMIQKGCPHERAFAILF